MSFLSKPVEQTQGDSISKRPFPPEVSTQSIIKKSFRRPCRRMPCVNIQPILACNGNRCTKAGLNHLHQGNNKPSPIFTVLWIRGKISQGTVLIKIQQHSLMCLSAGISWSNYKDPKDRIDTAGLRKGTHDPQWASEL